MFIESFSYFKLIDDFDLTTIFFVAVPFARNNISFYAISQGPEEA